MILLVATLLAFAATDVHGAFVGGRSTYINYNSNCGVWNNLNESTGLKLEECCPVDASFPGNPWQQLSVSYTQGSSVTLFSGNSGFNGLHPPGCPSYEVIKETILDDGTKRVGIEHVMKMGLLTVTKREEWGFFDKTIKITFKVKYDGIAGDKRSCEDIDRFSVMHAVDPDQDREPFGYFPTYNDVTFRGNDGLFAEATGPRSCKTLGYGICGNKLKDGAYDEVGFARWVPTTPVRLRDPQCELQDDSLHYEHSDRRKLYCGDEREFFFFVVWDRCNPEAKRRFLAAHKEFCQPCYNPPKSEKEQCVPRCAGECPCRGQVAHNDCNCAYKCLRRANATTTDVTTLIRGFEAEVGKCDGGRGEGQEAHFNVDTGDDTKPSDGDCATARAELASLKAKIPIATG